MSPARAQKTKARVRLSISRGPRRGLRQSSSPPLPPPPVGRRATGGLPPVPGALRSTSDGMGVKMEGMGDPVRMRLPHFGLDALKIGRGGWSFEKRAQLLAWGWSEHRLFPDARRAQN